MILITIVVIAALDTCIGNLLIPGKVGVVKNSPHSYSVYKYNRIFLIPVRMWVAWGYPHSLSRLFADFTIYYERSEVSKNTAIKLAKIISNKKEKIVPKLEEVWTNRKKKLEIVTEDERKLLRKMIDFDNKGMEEEAILVLKQIEELHK